MGLAVLFERLNPRFRDTEELGEAYELPILGTVPESTTIAAGDDEASLPFAEAESFRTLRARLRYFNVDHDVRTLLITSSASGDGKTTVAWNLARTAAGAGDAKVLLVEADLRNPGLARIHSLKQGPGLAEVLTHGVEMSSVIQIIDTSPTSVLSDAFPLMRQVSGVIVVGRLGTSTRDGAAHLRDELEKLGAPVLGVVANAVPVRRGRKYGYGYAYGYEGREAQGKAEDS